MDEAEARPSSAGDRVELRDLSTRLTSIVEAAERAAEDLRARAEERARERIAEAGRAATYRVAAAEEEAAELTGAARAEAEQMRSEAVLAVEAVHVEADSRRQEAEALAARTREEAERMLEQAREQAQRLLAEAEHNGGQVRAKARDDAREIVGAAHGAAREVMRDGSEMSDQLRELSVSLRSNAERLLRDIRLAHGAMTARLDQGAPMDDTAPRARRSAPDHAERPSGEAPSVDFDVPEFLPRPAEPEQ